MDSTSASVPILSKVCQNKVLVCQNKVLAKIQKDVNVKCTKKSLAAAAPHHTLVW